NTDAAVWAAGDVEAGGQGGFDGGDALQMSYVILGRCVAPAIEPVHDRLRVDAQQLAQFAARDGDQFVVAAVDHIGVARAAEKDTQQNMVLGRAVVKLGRTPGDGVDGALFAARDDDAKAVERVVHFAAAEAKGKGSGADITDGGEQVGCARRNVGQEIGADIGRGGEQDRFS